MSDAANSVKEMLEHVVEAMGLDAEIQVSEEGRDISAVVEGEGLGLLIGRQGATIDAIQHLAYKVAGQAAGEGVRVTVDAEGYRAQRAEALHQVADEAAENAVRTGQSVALDVMSASERKVVHERLKDRTDVETWSEGTEPHRHLVVGPL